VHCVAGGCSVPPFQTAGVNMHACGASESVSRVQCLAVTRVCVCVFVWACVCEGEKEGHQYSDSWCVCGGG